jgi:hypothetical protein
VQASQNNNVPLHPHPVAVHTDHPLISVVKKLTSETLSSKSILLRNATETLHIINAMCVHNNHFSTATGDTKKHQKMLRSAWLDTYTHRAAKLSAGIQNPQFYDIYAHLGNLAEIPLNSVGYWATIPYV